MGDYCLVYVANVGGNARASEMERYVPSERDQRTSKLRERERAREIVGIEWLYGGWGSESHVFENQSSVACRFAGNKYFTLGVSSEIVEE